MSFKICKLYSIKGFSIFSIWFLDISISTKVFINQVNYFWLDLFNTCPFKIMRVFTLFNLSDIIGRTIDTKIPIAIHSPGEIR